MRKVITLKKLKRAASPVFTLLFLVLYVAGTSQLELLHSFAHDHEASVSHTEEQEKNPCHRLIYHHDEGLGCDHSLHLMVSNKCQMCDTICHGDQNLLSNVLFAVPEFSQEHFGLYKINLDSYWAVISSSRAPPAHI